jgi:hypothetical protein
VVIQNEGSLPSSLKKGTSIVKKPKERALSLPGKLPAPNNSREIFFEIWEREAAPAELMPDLAAIYGLRLSLPESAAEHIGG